MTVCIAAVADGGKSVVLCSDQLATYNIFSWAVETEDPLKKIHFVDDRSAIMAAGNLNIADEIVRLARSYRDQRPDMNVTFGELVRYSYEHVRREKAQAAFLSPRGMTFATYLQGNTNLHPLLLHTIDNELMSFNLGVDLIAAESRGDHAMLWLIANPGVMTESTDVLCIGEGAGHAIYAALELKYTPKQAHDQVEGIVREAKTRSEKTRSVGSATAVFRLPRLAGEPDSTNRGRPVQNETLENGSIIEP